MENKILEILVDKTNLKGPAVFEHILIILHKVFEDFKTKDQKNAFSFEITKIGNRIRFFVVSPKKYTNFLKNQIYAHYSNVEIIEVGDYLSKVPDDKIKIGQVTLKEHFYFPIKTFTEVLESSSNEVLDPFSSITSAIGRSGKYTLNTFQVNFFPASEKIWKKNSEKIAEILTSDDSDFVKNLKLSNYYFLIKIITFPFALLLKLFKLIFGRKKEEEQVEEKENEAKKLIEEKLKKQAYFVSINIIHAGEDKIESTGAIKEIFSTLTVFDHFKVNSFQLKNISNDPKVIKEAKNREISGNDVLTTDELCGLVHLPTSYVKTPQINWVSARAFEPPSNLPIVDPDLTDNIKVENELTPIGITNFRGTNISFGIGPSDRRRHIYVLGKTGMGKSTLLENMIIDDIRKGRGVAVIDPHGDLAEGVIGFIPKNRTNQTIIFDPSDKNWPIAFNMLDEVSPEHRPLVASGLIGIFKKIFGDSWGPRLEHILRNIILALLESPNSNLISVPLMLTSDVFRQKVVAKVKDPIVKKFWVGEFEKMPPNQKVEASGPILNKVGQFLSSTILRNVLGQSKNTFSIRRAMDNQRIVIVNLSKGKIGEDASSLLGAMMVTKFQIDAMSRADIPESERKDFYLYVDEFQNFATDSFATILSEARKYKLNLVMANQYIDQMQESVKGAVFGNVGSIISFQVGFHDASILKEALTGEINEEDLMNLKKYNIYIKQLIDGMPSPVFSAGTFSPNKKEEEEFMNRYQKILKVSREKYSVQRKFVEEKIKKTMAEVAEQEKIWEKKKEDFKNKEKERKEKERQKKFEQKKKNKNKN
ncbi:DUF87 domain-containing protein [Candidatus Gracilibacteria bacterium]|nr:MAG: DUF87 domain-containing protein [Candidatus Gracilibacteria bacterium]